MEPFCFEGRSIFVKRDDLLHPDFKGNKARKFYSLFKLQNPLIKRLVSYGGAQSNAMLSLAALAKLKGWEFHYYHKELPKLLLQSPEGNFKAATQFGMHSVQIPAKEFDERIGELKSDAEIDESLFFVPQGGADAFAEEGVRLLAQELEQFKEQNGFATLNVIISCGTGTTALFLAKHLSSDIQVYAVPCVGDEAYLKQQMSTLCSELPCNLFSINTQKKYHFGAVYPEFLELYERLLVAGCVFDLLYDTKAWLALLENYDSLKKQPIMFIHSGGTNGNETMLKRYEHEANKKI